MLQTDKLAVNRAEACRLLSISLRTLDALIARKEIPCRRVGRRVIFAVSQLEKFLQKDHPSGRKTGPSTRHDATTAVSKGAQ